MDRREYSNLRAMLEEVPDPRARRGRRYPWPLLLTLIAAALASGQRGGRAIGQWVREHAAALAATLEPPGGRLPSPTTLRRALRAVDADALEARVARFVAGLPTPPPPAATAPWVGQALDGKAVRGANRHGARLHLVSLARHGDGRVLAQRAVPHKGGEVSAAPHLLAGRDLTGTVTTTDALLATRALARQVRAQGGHYLMVVKGNRAAVVRGIETYFAGPPRRPADQAITVGKGHGRLEERTLERRLVPPHAVGWPGIAQVLRRTCRRLILATGAVQEEVTYAVTSLPAPAGAAVAEALWRGHWAIENRAHHVRDVTWGEDAGQQRAGSAPQALAALRNALLGLLRALGWTNIADALRHYGATPLRALRLLSLAPR
jgi:predicted transposase YbfD/YdcC